MNGAINGILFDLDGTLLDHRGAAPDALTAWVSALAPGHPRLAEAAALWAALEIPHLAAWQAGECSWQEQRRRRVRALCRELGVEPPADLEAGFAAYAEHYRRGWAAYPDVAPALARLRGHTFGILTNGSQGVQEAKVRALGLDLGPVLTGECLGGQFKPSPGCYTAAARALGLPPEQVLLVGDDLDKDVRGPAAVGMPSVWIDRLGAEPAPAGFPRITSLTELPQLLALLAARP
ncbi:HAD family hydrolase [Nonomuraea sp. WAC 01424]|uniref:HAD family hydrolase n=1 Tax=Nonomuraea sp. WAC 01424 TaxID=2203200 RepID=UPI00163C2982|nr:HAD family hydrolase [Nonomuraea sp. WAC 01424]